jgi:hypothetical protein
VSSWFFFFLSEFLFEPEQPLSPSFRETAGLPGIWFFRAGQVPTTSECDEEMSVTDFDV